MPRTSSATRRHPRLPVPATRKAASSMTSTASAGGRSAVGQARHVLGKGALGLGPELLRQRPRSAARARSAALSPTTRVRASRSCLRVRARTLSTSDVTHARRGRRPSSVECARRRSLEERVAQDQRARAVEADLAPAEERLVVRRSTSKRQGPTKASSKSLRSKTTFSAGVRRRVSFDGERAGAERAEVLEMAVPDQPALRPAVRRPAWGASRAARRRAARRRAGAPAARRSCRSALCCQQVRKAARALAVESRADGARGGGGRWRAWAASSLQVRSRDAVRRPQPSRRARCDGPLARCLSRVWGGWPRRALWSRRSPGSPAWRGRRGGRRDARGIRQDAAGHRVRARAREAGSAGGAGGARLPRATGRCARVVRAGRLARRGGRRGARSRRARSSRDGRRASSWPRSRARPSRWRPASADVLVLDGVLQTRPRARRSRSSRSTPKSRGVAQPPCRRGAISARRSPRCRGQRPRRAGRRGLAPMPASSRAALTSGDGLLSVGRPARPSSRARVRAGPSRPRACASWRATGSRRVATVLARRPRRHPDRAPARSPQRGRRVAGDPKVRTARGLAHAHPSPRWITTLVCSDPRSLARLSAARLDPRRPGQ